MIYNKEWKPYARGRARRRMRPVSARVLLAAVLPVGYIYARERISREGHSADRRAYAKHITKTRRR